MTAFPDNSAAAAGSAADKVSPAPPAPPAGPPAPEFTRRRADCCIAQASYRIVLPANDQRRHATEILLCGHHFRASTEGLLLARAAAFDSTGRLVVSSITR